MNSFFGWEYVTNLWLALSYFIMTWIFSSSVMITILVWKSWDALRYVKMAVETWIGPAEVTGLLESLELSIMLEFKFTTEAVPVVSLTLHLIGLTWAQINLLSGLAGNTSWRFDAQANSANGCYLLWQQNLYSLHFDCSSEAEVIET